MLRRLTPTQKVQAIRLAVNHTEIFRIASCCANQICLSVRHVHRSLVAYKVVTQMADIVGCVETRRSRQKRIITIVRIGKHRIAHDITGSRDIYIAYREDISEVSEMFHNNIRDRFDRGEKQVVNAMKFWARLTDKAKNCLLDGKPEKIGELLNANFDRRRKIYKISSGNIHMAEAARAVGASAKFTGSGGAIVGTYTDGKMFNNLKKELKRIKVKVIKPKIAKPSKGEII